MPLKILLVDKDTNRAEALSGKLTASGFAEVQRVPGGDGITKALETAKPDLIIVDMALPDRDVLEDIRAMSAAHPVVMFAGGDDPSFAEEAIAAGVCSYNLSGVALEDLKPIMASAVALFQRYRRVEVELAATKALLEERRLIERAKAILMRGRKMTEPEAYRFLQKKAMNENRKLREIAAEFVRHHEEQQA
ncbi:MAG TPA: ANTAR domain-containing protein [Methylocella sp.]|nr:ANTAR domain-containing protein [Methylocella sp.]